MAITLNKKYQPLFTSKKRYHLLTGGRGSGKSYVASTFINLLTYERGHKILFTRWTMTSADISIIPELKEKIDELGVGEHFYITKDEIRNKLTGSSIIFRGIKTSSGVQTASLKSLHGITTWVIDEAEELVDEKIFSKIAKSIRMKGVQNRIVLILNPTARTHWIWRRWFEKSHRTDYVDNYPIYLSTHASVNHIHSTYLDNINNLSEDYLESEIYQTRENDKYAYGYEIIGGWILQPEGALYGVNDIKRFRMKDLKKEDAEVIYGYVDVADQGTDSYSFPIAHVYKNAIYITSVLHTPDPIDTTLPLTESLIKAQTIYNEDGKTIKKELSHVRVEANNQGMEIVRRLRERFDPSKILAVNNNTNKHTRILDQRLFTVQYVYLLDDADIPSGSDYERFLQGIFDYNRDQTKNKHDDAPDALSGLTVMCRSFMPHLFV